MMRHPFVDPIKDDEMGELLTPTFVDPNEIKHRAVLVPLTRMRQAVAYCGRVLFGRIAAVPDCRSSARYSICGRALQSMART